MRRAAAGVLFALGLAPAAASAAEVQLSFGDAPGGASGGFRVERRETGAKRFEALALVGPGIADFVDRGLPAGVTYCYRVRALAAEGDSAWSPEVCAEAREPAAPLEPAPAAASGEPAAGEPAATEPGASEPEAAETPPAAEAPAPAPAEGAADTGEQPPRGPEPRRIRTSGGWLQVLD